MIFSKQKENIHLKIEVDSDTSDDLSYSDSPNISFFEEYKIYILQIILSTLILLPPIIMKLFVIFKSSSENADDCGIQFMYNYTETTWISSVLIYLGVLIIIFEQSLLKTTKKRIMTYLFIFINIILIIATMIYIWKVNNLSIREFKKDSFSSLFNCPSSINDKYTNLIYVVFSYDITCISIGLLIALAMLVASCCVCVLAIMECICK
jgi:hypothetical protein